MTLLWALIIAFIGQALFIYGFLPIKIAGRKVAEERQLPTRMSELRMYKDSLYKPVVNKLILLVIDALRDDFTTGSEVSQHMPYLASLIDDGEGIHFTSRVEPPTVTLPRIKAITMGTIPNYADVILNVLERESNSSKEDSFIDRASSNKLKTIFYGDDTWLRLFPNSFLRSDGTSSFYVSDFSEVDNNVTRHLDHELRQDDWDIMILHYLGLDHIGHIHGPYSKLVPVKLREMDDVIKKLHHGLKKMGHSSLLVICGDHGMKDTGGHGGATYSETHVPLIFVSPSVIGSKGHCRESNTGDGIVLQRDLAPTLSALLGLKPPSMNLGTAIPCILRMHIPDNEAFLYALHVNAWQVASLLRSEDDSSKVGGLYLFNEAVKLHSEWIKSNNTRMLSWNGEMKNEDDFVKDIAEKYAVSISQMTSKLAESLVNFDFCIMFVGVVITWQAFMISVLRKESTNFKNGFQKVVCVFAFIMVLLFTTCCFGPTLISNSSLCVCHPVALLVNVSIAFTLSFNFHKIFCKHDSYSEVRLKLDGDFVSTMIRFGTFLHVLSLFSSSFIEEEHQTWQFLCVSLIILLGVTRHFSAPLKSDHHAQSRKYINFFGSVPIRYQYKIEDQNVYFTPVKDWKPFNKKEWVYFIIVLCIHRILRDYNHTGDKWGHLPDIGDWISESENICIRSVVMALSLIGINVFLILNSPANLLFSDVVLIIFTAPCIYAYRAAIGDVSSLNLYPSSRGTTEFNILLIMIIVIFVRGCLEAFKVLTHGGNKGNDSLIEGAKGNRNPEQEYLTAFVILTHELCKFWTILCSSLNRPGDVPIILAFLLACQAIVNFVMRSGRFDVYTVSKTFIWLGMVFYFFKGNSNSLASVDLKAAYTGQENYSIFIVGILLFCHTFSMPILALLLLFHNLAVAVSGVHNVDLRCTEKTMDAAIKSVIMTRLFPVVVYLPFIILQRHHLFIWTVFAPKLLYEAFFTLASLFGISIVIVLSRCLGYLANLKRVWFNSSMSI